MAETDFDQWRANEKPLWRGSYADIAKRAWLAAEERLLRPQAATFPQQVAASLLNDGEAALAIFADWFQDNGRLEPAVAARLMQLKAALSAFVTALEHGRRTQYVELDEADAMARRLLMMPAAPASNDTVATVLNFGSQYMTGSGTFLDYRRLFGDLPPPPVAAQVLYPMEFFDADEKSVAGGGGDDNNS